MSRAPKRAREADHVVTVRIHPKEQDEEDSENEFYDDDDDDDLGDRGDYECTRAFSGDVLVEGQVAGSFSAHLVDRERAGSIFHAACDAESAELQEMGCALFSSNGAPRYSALKSDASVQRGGFIYVDTFNINSEHRVNGATDVGAAAIRSLLSCPQIFHRWTVASYIADSNATQSAAELEAERERQLAEFRGGAPETAAEKARRIAGVNERMARDARQFLRAGFAEMAYKEGGWLYITKGMMQTPPLSHNAAMGMPLRLTTTQGPAASAGLTEADENLLRELKSLSTSAMIAGDVGAMDASMLAMVDRCVAQGADLTRAGVLQFCTATDRKDLLVPMLSRGAQINGPDGQTGATALMVAAGMIPGKTGRFKPQHDSTMVSTLIALGADKNVVDHNGLSALGHYFSAIRSTNDFFAAMGIKDRRHDVDPTVQAMLRPAAGPTAADRECADDH